MIFDIITIFPNIFDSYFKESIIKRAQEKKIVKINIHNLRDYTKDKHRTVDDKPYGGGPGMILKVEPIYRAVRDVRIIGNVRSVKNKQLQQAKRLNKRNDQTFLTILLSPRGKKFDQKTAHRFSKSDQIILICGRYEGVDERVSKYIADEEISIGDYVLTGGELPAMVVVDAITRLIPGVIKEDSLKEETFSFRNKEEKLKIKNQSTQIYLSARPSTKENLLCSGSKFKILNEYPQYTRPENFKGWRVPKVLLSGNHKKIEEWKKKIT